MVHNSKKHSQRRRKLLMAQKYYAYLAGMKFRLITPMLAAAAFAVFVPIIAASAPAVAAKSCDDNPSGNPKDALRLLDKVEAFVPFVPPEEAAYLEKEETAASEIHSSQRFGALVSRPYYYARKLHIEFAIARDRLKELNGLPEIGGIKIRIFMASNLPFALSNVRSSWDDYYWNDRSHPISVNNVRVLTEDMMALAGMPGFYIWCLADSMDEKNR